jgi:hypothetical protein
MAQDTRPPEESLVRSAGLIFAGTVEERGRSSVPAIKPADNLIVVRVDRGLRVDKALGDIRGKLITVAVKDPKAFRAGQQAVFFTNSWIHGQGIAVREVEHADVQAQDSVAAIVAKLPELHLKDRLLAAVLVVHAVVTRVGPVERVSLVRDDALWRTAELNVLNVLRGAPRSPTIVHFPTSKHPDWARAPRFTEGQRGVFVLHPASGSKHPSLAALPPGALVVLDPDDFQPESRLAEVENLVAAIR